MATYYIDPANGTDSQSGQPPVKKLACQVTSASTTVVVPNNTSLTAGMKVFSTDMENSGGLFASGTTISSISGNNVTLSAAAVGTNASATVIFSPAKKTISSVTGLLGQGDVVRVKQSGTPAETAIAASWNSGSSSISGSFPIKVIDNCESAFIDAGNATLSTSTSASSYVEGSKSCFIFGNIGQAMAGVLVYRPVSLDLSGYSRVSMMIACNGLVAMKFNLCSDALGRVPVYSGTIPFGTTLGTSNSSPAPTGMYPVVIDMGQDMTTQINSISFEKLYSINLQFFLHVDNIVACKSASDPNAITHKTLFSTGLSDQWYQVRSLSPTAADLFMDSTLGYPKPSYTGNLYKREPTYTPYSYNFTIGNIGTESNPITISGGWDNVDMGTQTSTETLLQDDKTSTTISIGNNVHLSKFGTVGSVAPISLTGKNNRLTDCQFINTVASSLFSVTSQNAVVTCNNVSVAGLGIAYQTFYSGSPAVFSLGSGSSVSNFKGSFEAVKVIDAGTVFSPTAYESADIVANNSFFSGNYLWANETSTKKAVFSDSTFRKFTSLNCGTSSASALKQVFRNCSFDFTNNATGKVSAFGGSYFESEIRFDKFNQVSTDHRIYKPGGTILSHSGAYRHTASGISWGLSPTSTSLVDSYAPLTLPIARVPVTAGASFSASVWVYRTGSDVSAGIRVKAGDVPALSEQKVLMTAAAGSWEQITLTFTPESSGVVEIEAFAYGTTTSTAYFDDFSAS